MKKRIVFIWLTAGLLLFQPVRAQQDPSQFSFVFMTDIHVQPERRAMEGFKASIASINELEPDFVITGGDLVMDALGQSYERADSLYQIYDSLVSGLRMPVHNTLGNHEIYGWYARSGADPRHPEYGKQIFEKRIGPRYKTFEHLGWRFIILDSVTEDGKGGYQGGIDQEQVAWLKDILRGIAADQPIVISVHIPFLTTEAQILRGSLAANEPGEVITNSKEVLELLKDHNLRLILQGHLHYYETLHVFGTDFITGGAVSGAWWTGPYLRTEEGFLLLSVNGKDLTWEYVDYGWQVDPTP